MISNIPASNRKVFAISFIIALVAIVGFIIFVKYNSDQTMRGVDQEVLAENPDPVKVFDAPFTKANIYFINLDAKSGQTATAGTSTIADADAVIGCGDGLLPYNVTLDQNQGGTKSDTVSYLLGRLFSAGNLEAVPLEGMSADAHPYNPLVNSKLKVEKIKDVPGEYEVYLTGTLRIGGTCDAPRIQAQIEKTVNQVFAPMTAKVFLNKKPLSQALSTK